MTQPFQIEGTSYVLQADYAALSAIEKALDGSVATISLRLAEGRLCLEELVQVIALCARPALSAADAQSLLMQHYAATVETLAMLLAGFFSPKNAFQDDRETLQALMMRFPDN